MKKIKEIQERAAAEIRELAEKELAPAQKKVEEARKKLDDATAELSMLEESLGIKKEVPAKGKKGTKANNFVFVKTPEKVGTGQKKQILDLIEKRKTVTREELLKDMASSITTKMSPSALLSYYTPELVKAGAITIS